MLAFSIGYNPWLWLLIFIVVMAAGILLLSVISSLIIARAAAKYSDKIIPKYQQSIEKLLPGTDCGKCKRCSCAEFADAVLHTEIDEYACPYLNEETVNKILDLREKLQKSMEDPTPPEKKEPRFWEQKF